MRRSVVRTVVTAVVVSAGLLPALPPGAARAQGLAEFDYENLAFRGVGFRTGYIFPDRVEPAYTFGVRMDLGYLGPGLRIVPGVTYWSSRLDDEEVGRLETKLQSLIESQLPAGSPAPTVDLGVIDWSDIVITVDGQFVWAVPLGLLSFAGAGLSAHILNGEGAAIGETFVEDLLDTVTGGFNVHAGLEFPLSDRFRLYGLGRYEFLEDLRYMELRFGGQIMFAPPAPGEQRGGR